MRKMILAAMVAGALVSCKKELPVTAETSTKTKTAKTAARLNPGENIRLLKARTVAAYYSRSYIRIKGFYAELANIAYAKKVFVHHKMSDGTWKDFPLTYIGPAENNAEIRGWEFSYGVGTPLAAGFAQTGFSDEFVLKYIVNGQTYWDNNGSRNYNISSPYITDGFYLQDGLNISTDLFSSSLRCNSSTGTLQVYADLRNIAYTKEVNMVYTTDNWRTTNNAALSYASTYGYGGSNLNAFPGQQQFEKWAATVTVPAKTTQVKFAVSYKVNGQTYWDNNYGRDYILNRQ